MQRIHISDLQRAHFLGYFGDGSLRADQSAAAAAVADLREEHGGALEINQGVEPAEIHTFSASGAFFGIKRGEWDTHAPALYRCGAQEDPAVGLLHIAIDIGAVTGGTASGAFFGIKRGEWDTHAPALYRCGAQEDPAVGLLHIAIDIGAVTGGSRKINAEHGFPCAALSAEQGDLHRIP